MSRYRAQIIIEFDADDDEQAEEHLYEIEAGLDWTAIPEHYNVAYESPEFLGQEGCDSE